MKWWTAAWISRARGVRSARSRFSAGVYLTWARFVVLCVVPAFRLSLIHPGSTRPEHCGIVMVSYINPEQRVRPKRAFVSYRHLSS